MTYQPGPQRRSKPGSLGGIRFQSRPDAVAEKLREAIMSGALKPGDRLIERKLASAFGVGQPTLREGLMILELQGFVRKQTTKGTYVTQLGPDDFRKILEVRLALEALAIERAAVRMTPSATADLSKRVTAMEHAARKFDLAAFHRNDLQFHRRIWDLADNSYLGIALERVAFGLFAFVLLQRQPDATNEFLASACQHQRILEGLKSGDPALARRAFVEATLEFWGRYHQVNIAGAFDQPVLSFSSSDAGPDSPAAGDGGGPGSASAARKTAGDAAGANQVS